MHLPGEKTWSPGVCAGLVGPRSYEVKVLDRTFVRNHRQLIKSDDHVVENTAEAEESTQETGVPDPPTPQENTSTLPQTEVNAVTSS